MELARPFLWKCILIIYKMEHKKCNLIDVMKINLCYQGHVKTEANKYGAFLPWKFVSNSYL